MAFLRALCLNSRAATSSGVCRAPGGILRCRLWPFLTCLPQGQAALCRHMDGVWRSADEAPRGADGRLLAHVALNGHGSYPTAGFIPRNLLAFNDYTSDQGAVWDPVSISFTLVYTQTLLVSMDALLCASNTATWAMCQHRPVSHQ